MLSMEEVYFSRATPRCRVLPFHPRGRFGKFENPFTGPSSPEYFHRKGMVRRFPVHRNEKNRQRVIINQPSRYHKLSGVVFRTPPFVQKKITRLLLGIPLVKCSMTYIREKLRGKHQKWVNYTTLRTGGHQIRAINWKREGPS